MVFYSKFCLHLQLRLKYFPLRDIALPLGAFRMKRKEPYLDGREGPEIHMSNMPRGTNANKIYSDEGDGGGMVGENAPWLFISLIFLKKGEGR